MKKGYLIIIISILLCLLGVLLYYKVIKPKRIENNSDITYIEYSFGGGYGTIADTATRNIIIDESGHVSFTNNYDSHIETFTLNNLEYDKLRTFIMESFDLFINKPRENNDVLDGVTSHITIKRVSGEEYKIGGYAIMDNRYGKMVNKIIDTAGRERFNKYSESIK